MNHLSIIMDGNGRWAETQSMPRLYGHLNGAKAVVKALNSAIECQIKVLSLYAFSTENFKRSDFEVSGIFDIIAEVLLKDVLPFSIRNDVKIKFIGNKMLPSKLISVMEQLESETMSNKKLTALIAIAYGGEEEIVHSVNKIFKKRLLNNDFSPISIEDIKSNLYTEGLPYPDVVVRYGGQNRLSNFMPLQTVYSELIFTEKLWPDFDEHDIEEILSKFNKIKRNYGAIDA